MTYGHDVSTHFRYGPVGRSTQVNSCHQCERKSNSLSLRRHEDDLLVEVNSRVYRRRVSARFRRRIAHRYEGDMKGDWGEGIETNRIGEGQAA
jgi:hypothetical protein